MSNRPTTPISVVLCGATGRMGAAILSCAERDSGHFRVAASWERGAAPPMALTDADIVIDFSSPGALRDLLAACGASRKPLVIGTTGYDEQAHRDIAQAAQVFPIVLAANFSVGVNTLFWLTREAARILGAGFDLEVIEMHHRLKRDAPSGTARRLAEILAQARGISPEADVRHGRQGLIGERPQGEIGVHAIRGGDIVGEHTVLFAGEGERLELIHRAASRETFASGALRAAAWLQNRAPGLYDMEDVLGLTQPGFSHSD